MQHLTTFMNDYGYIILFLSLVLGILALPIPVEAMMGYAGLLSYAGQLNWIFSILSAAAGCTLGMILAYLIGYKLGMPFFEKYGQRFHLGPEKLHSTSVWFEKFGNKLILVAFFIPGVRHFTGYFSGITRLPFRIFTTFSALGSIIWVSTFVFLGKMLGPKWETFHDSINKYLIMGSIILAILLIVFYLVKRFKTEIIQFSIKTGKRILNRTRSLRRAELFLGILSLVTIGFIILMISIIQNYLSDEISDFDEVANLLVSVIFKGNQDVFLNFFFKLGTSTFLLCLIFFTILWTVWKGKDKLLEFYFLVITVGGGELYEALLRSIFNSVSQKETPLLGRFPYSFPSEQSLMAFVIYGFFFYILLRHSKSITLHTTMIFSWVTILMLIGISRAYFHVQDPSQIAAGYVFGGVWLGISTLLLEIFRMLINIDHSKNNRNVKPKRSPS